MKKKKAKNAHTYVSLKSKEIMGYGELRKKRYLRRRDGSSKVLSVTHLGSN